MTIRRPVVLALPLLLFLATTTCAPGADDATDETEEEMNARAREIHDRVITLDTHDDISTANFTAERNYTMDLSTQVTLPKMEAGGLDVAWFVVFTGQGPHTDEGYAAAYENAIDKFDAIHRLTEEIAPDRIELALTSDDVRRIVASGKKVAMIGVENAYPLGTDISRVEEFHARGARYMSLAHTGPSQLSDAHGEADNFLHNGLSDLGREAIAEMNRLGIMIDISHPSKPSIMQTLELTRAPVVASHSAARALSDVSRNLDDEQLRGVGENGGVIQTVALRSFVNTTKNAARSEAMGAIQAEIAAEMGFELLDRAAIGALPRRPARRLQAEGEPVARSRSRASRRGRSGRRERCRLRRPHRLHGQPDRPRACGHQLGLRRGRRRGWLGRRVGDLRRHAGARAPRIFGRRDRHAVEREPAEGSRRGAGSGSNDSGRRGVGK